MKSNDIKLEYVGHDKNYCETCGCRKGIYKYTIGDIEPIYLCEDCACGMSNAFFAMMEHGKASVFNKEVGIVNVIEI